MYWVYFEEYTNDYCRKERGKSFYSLKDFQDWFFAKCKGKYEDKISIPNPDSWIWKDGPSAMDVNCMREENKHYWVHMIKNDETIIFSDGHNTNRIKHWNEDTKQLCRKMLERKQKPQFNFG